MKIGIVTVYHSYNCGSFLQAYAMQKTLKEFGCDPYFLKNQRTRESKLWYRLLQAGKYICIGNPKRAKHLLQVYYNFHRAQQALPLAADYTGMETVVYGSDTIWNVRQKTFLKNWKKFYGAEFDGRKVGYAASVGAATLEELLNHPGISRAVAELDAIGVRDQATDDFVHACCGEDRQTTFVVDPTMLLTAQHYGQLALEIRESNYILFYYFGAIPQNIKKQIRAFADRTGRKIVVFGQNEGWADQYISHDPYLMLGYYKNADYVITNTFHGNVFSLIFNKQFISFGKERQKICDLLERFDQAERLADEEADIASLLDEPVCHDKTNEKLEAFRTQSLQFLRDSIFNKRG